MMYSQLLDFKFDSVFTFWYHGFEVLTMSIITNRIKVLRKALGISQKELANLSGVSLSTIQRIENPNSTNSPSIGILDKLDMALMHEYLLTLYPEEDRSNSLPEKVYQAFLSGDSREKESTSEIMSEVFFSIAEVDLIGEIYDKAFLEEYGSSFDDFKDDGIDKYDDDYYSERDDRKEKHLLRFFRKLNDSGKEKVIEFTKDLAGNPAYKAKVDE